MQKDIPGTKKQPVHNMCHIVEHWSVVDSYLFYLFIIFFAFKFVIFSAFFVCYQSDQLFVAEQRIVYTIVCCVSFHIIFPISIGDIKIDNECRC